MPWAQKEQRVEEGEEVEAEGRGGSKEMSDLEYMRSKMVRSAWDEDGSNGEGAVVAEVDPDEGEEGGEG